MAGIEYLEKIKAIISKIQKTQQDKIQQAAELMAEAIGSGHRVYLLAAAIQSCRSWMFSRATVASLAFILSMTRDSCGIMSSGQVEQENCSGLKDRKAMKRFSCKAMISGQAM